LIKNRSLTDKFNIQKLILATGNKPESVSILETGSLAKDPSPQCILLGKLISYLILIFIPVVIAYELYVFNLQ